MNTFERLVFSFVIVSSLSAITSVALFSSMLSGEGLSKVGYTALALAGDIKQLKTSVLDSSDVKVYEPVEIVEEPVVVKEPEIENNLPTWRPLTKAKEELLSDRKDFLEVNFSANKVIKYEQGQPFIEKTILNSGDPQGWGGTPAGLYSVSGKNEKAFSVAAGAYMPNAIHFYGKYFIHGEPYYNSGEKIVADFSGGCIQLADGDIGSIFNVSSVGLPVLVLDSEYINRHFNDVENSLPKITAKSFAVVDLESGSVLAEKEAETKRPMASITKLMTAVVVAENIDLRKGVYANDTMLDAYGATAGLVSGGFYKIVELFYPLLTESSNDAAEVLTGFMGRDKTISLMNKKADHLFMKNTRFSDPSGFDEGNISTAQDLTTLARYVYYNRKPILDITKDKPVVTFGPISFDVAVLDNKNKFEKDKSFIGGKTGYTDEARNTGLFIFNVKNKDGEEFPIVVSVLASESLKQDTEKILKWVEKEYELERVG